MKEYYYLKDGAPVGPFTLEELHALHLDEKISLDTMVSKEGASEWLNYAVLLPKDAEPKLPAVPSAAPTPEPVAPFAVAKEGCPHCQADLPISQQREVPYVCPKCFSDIHSKDKSMWGYFTYAFSQYATFKGRATRMEFWSFILFVMIFSFALAGVGVVIPFVSLVFELVIFIPSLAILFRRFHDVNLSGWWVILIKALPLVTVIVATIYFMKAVAVIAGEKEQLAEILFLPTQGVSEDPNAIAEYDLNAELLWNIVSQAWGQTWEIVSLGVIIIPLLCTIFGFIVCVTDSKRGVNKYGVSTKYPIA